MSNDKENIKNNEDFNGVKDNSSDRTMHHKQISAHFKWRNRCWRETLTALMDDGLMCAEYGKCYNMSILMI